MTLFQDDMAPPMSAKEKLRIALQQRTQRKHSDNAPIVAASMERHRLSYSQQRLWFLEQMEGASGTYTMATALRLHGALDAVCLSAALDALTERHQVLRSLVDIVDGEPIQVYQAVGPRLDIIDLTGLGAAVRERALDACKQQIVDAPFQLGEGHMFRPVLVCISDHEAVLTLTMHHIVADGWSLNVLIRDLLSLYHGLHDRQAPALQPLPIQFGDYAEWQREQQGAMDTDIEFWTGRLHDAPRLLELPLDRPRSAHRSSAGALLVETLDADLRERLDVFSRAQGVSLFSTLMAVFATMLSRHSGQSDIVIGTPVANRGRPETTDLVGFFANSLSLRLQLDPDQPADHLVRAVHATLLDAMEHQDAPFERVVEALDLERSFAYTPVFQVMFGLNNTASLPQAMHASGVDACIEQMPVGGAKFDLSVTYNDNRGELVGYWEYSRDLFDSETVSAFAARFRKLLEAVLDAHGDAVAQLPLITDVERDRVIDWAAGADPLEVDMHPVTKLAQRAAETPDAVAVIAGDTMLTYAMLEARANGIAHYLQARGVEPEDRVALVLERDHWLPVLMLATLKAGACYIAIDPRLPEYRVSSILADSQARLLISCRDDHVLPDMVPVSEISIIDGADSGPCALQMHADGLVYVVYTSGTSGTPKGVAIQARGLVNLSSWHATEFGLSADSRASVLAGVGFDAIAWELWPNLLHGGCVVMLADETVQAPDLLCEALNRHCISHSFMPTPLAEGVFDKLADLSYPDVLMVGGDRLVAPPSFQPRFRLVNNYGPSEVSVVSTSGEVTDHRNPSIGRPISGLSTIVLDESMQPLPPGIVGELFVGGEGLARGYLGQARLTAERFVPDPFSGKEGARLYRTGDLVRWRRDGRLDFVGRADMQIKLRGFRIEIAEIEAQLLQCPQVDQAVVELRHDNSGEARLVAYFTGEDGGDAPTMINEHLRARLPDYMVPSMIVPLATMPRTVNGKVDRRALADPDWGDRADAHDEPPVGKIEMAMAAIWAELLGLSRVGRHATFFELGGHSMLAARMLDVVRDRFGVVPPLKDLWSHSSIAAFSARLQHLLESSEGLEDERLPQIRHDATNRYQPFALTDIQQAYWLGRSDAFDIGNVAAHAYSEHELYATEFSIEHFEMAVNRLIERHDMLRMVVDEDGRQRVLADPGRYRVPYLDLTQNTAKAREATLIATREEMSHRVFEPNRWPLFDLRISKLSAHHHRLYWSFDGLVLDGFSQQVLIHELMTVLAEPEAELPELGITFRDYVVGLEALVQSEVYRTSEAYWLARIDDFPGPPELPLAVDPSKIAQPRFVRREFRLPAAQWSGLKRAAPSSDRLAVR